MVYSNLIIFQSDTVKFLVSEDLIRNLKAFSISLKFSGGYNVIAIGKLIVSIPFIFKSLMLGLQASIKVF